MNSRLRHLLLLPPAVAFVLMLVFGWPGGVSPDMRVSIHEGRNFQFWGHQEPMCGFLWACFQVVFPAWFVIVAMFFAQGLVFFGSLALLAREALRAGSVFTAVLAAASSFVPPLLCFSVMVESNIQCGIAWFAAIAVAASSRARLASIAWMLLLWYGFVVRSGMVVSIVPAAYACLALSRPERGKWRTLALAVVVGLGFQGLSLVVTNTLLGAPTRFSVLSVSRTFDMAGIHQRTGVHHVPSFMVPEGKTAEDVFANYEPHNVSGMFWRGDDKPTFRMPQNEDEGEQIRAAWMQTIREFPMEWVRVKLRYAQIFLMIGVDWAYSFWPDYSANVEFGLSQPENAHENWLGRYAQETATTLLWKGWFWLAVVGVVVAAGIFAGAQRAGAAAALYLGGVASFVPHFLFGQAALSRYYFLPYSLLLASALLVLPGVIARLRRATSPAEDSAAA